MTRVWSMATQPSHTDRDLAQIEDVIVYVCGDAPRPSRPSLPSPPIASDLTSAPSSPNYAQEMRHSLLPFPLSLITWNSGISDPATSSRSSNRSIEDQDSVNSQQMLPDVVNVELRVRSANGHIHARRAVSVSLPLDSETIRSVGVSLRRISEEFEVSTSRTILSDWRSASDGLFSNMLASIGLSRRRPRSRNGRQRSFSTNDATQQ